MNLYAFILIVVAAILHASWNLVLKQAASAGIAFLLFFRLFSALIYLPWVIYTITQNIMPWNAMVALFLFLSTALHLLYGLVLMQGYSKADLSVVYPVARGTGPVLASATAIILLGESIYLTKIAGIVAVLLGTSCIAFNGKWNQPTQANSLVAIRWGLLIGCFIAAYSLVDAYGVQSMLIAPVVLEWVSSAGGAFLLAPAAIKQRKNLLTLMQGHWKKALFVAVAAPMGYILILYALHLGAEVSQVAPLREMSMVMATLMGALILKETVGLVRWIGCSIILAGVILISA